MANGPVPDIACRRLAAQRISGRGFRTPAAAVAWLGAIQAQDYLAALWAIGLRTTGATEAVVEAAVASKAIVRTWPMRGTLHFVAAADLRWMVALLAPRTQRQRARMLERHFDLTPKVIAKARPLVERTLRDGPVTREALYQSLDDHGIETGAGRGLHLIFHLAHDGLICFGPRAGKQPTLVLVDQWLPPEHPWAGDEALGELALRYFASHGPARLVDFSWWSGLTMKDAARAVDIARPRLVTDVRGDLEYFAGDTTPAGGADAGIHLLPSFDQFLVGYKDRSAALPTEHARRAIGANGLFSPAIVVGGQVIGTWKRALTRGQAVISLDPFVPMKKAARAALLPAIRRYGVFLGVPAVLAAR